MSDEVHCEKRTITLRTEYRIESKPTELTNAVFEGVEGYHFDNDAFGSVIFELATVPLEQFLAENGAEISALRRRKGSPAGAADLLSARSYLDEQGIKAFYLSSSLGLSGWVVAKECSILPAQ